MMASHDLTHRIIGGALAVHSALGPGLLESAYVSCLAHELELRGMTVQRQVPLALDYRGLRVEGAYRLDLVVDDCVVVEAKAVACLAPIHRAQLITYLRLAKLPVGLLFNFNTRSLREDGMRRLFRPSL